MFSKLVCTSAEFQKRNSAEFQEKTTPSSERNTDTTYSSSTYIESNSLKVTVLCSQWRVSPLLVIFRTWCPSSYGQEMDIFIDMDTHGHRHGSAADTPIEIDVDIDIDIYIYIDTLTLTVT
jgi:hypothetical protein